MTFNGMETVSVIHGAFEPFPRLVAFVDVDPKLSLVEKAEVAFKLTNNIDRPWVENPGVTPMGTSRRSSSVGDMVLVGNTKLKCKSSGWDMV